MKHFRLFRLLNVAVLFALAACQPVVRQPEKPAPIEPKGPTPIEQKMPILIEHKIPTRPDLLKTTRNIMI